MKVIVKPEIMARLLSYALATPNEFSGFGFCERQGSDIFVYDFVLLNVGSFGYTEIDPRRMLPILERPDRLKMKVWLHRHPMGNGIPGQHNWSSRDELTIQREPLGSTPEAVNWSVSLVLTPSGFVGRIDNYVKHITEHLEVEPNTTDFFAELRSLEAQCWAQKSSEKRGKKSKNSREFPAQETQKPPKTKTIRFTGKSKKKSSNSKKKKTADMTLLQVWGSPTPTSFSASSPENSNQPEQPWLISAMPTGSIGTKNGTGESDVPNTNSIDL